VIGNGINTYIIGQTTNGQAYYQWFPGTYYAPSSYTIPLIVRNDFSDTGYENSKPGITIYNNNGGINTTAHLSFASAEEATGVGNSVALGGIIAKKEIAGSSGAWTNGSLMFYTKNGATRTEAVFIANGGNVGIGNTSPGEKLDVSGNARLLAGGILKLVTASSNERGTIQALEATGAGAPGLVIATSGGEEIVFKDATDINMVIKGSGDVGIGTNTPVAKLDVSGNISLAYNSGATDRYIIRSYAASHVSTDVPNNTSFGVTDGPGYAAGTFVGMNVGGVRNSANTYNNYYVDFYSHEGGVSAGVRMRIAVNGNIGIGTTSPATKLDVRGFVTSDVGNNGVEGGFYLGNSAHGLRRPGSSSNDVYVYTTSGTLYMGTTGSSSQQLILLNGGNFGVGISPGYKLHVNGDIGCTRIYTGNLGINLSSYGSMSQTVSGQMTIIGHNVAADPSVANKVNVLNSGWYSSMIRMYYTEGIAFHSSNTSYNAGDTFYQSGVLSNELMRITNGGNVGIGYTGPSYKLDVNGDIRGERYRGINSLVLNTYATVNPASNVFLYSQPNDRDAWLFLDSADTGSNWGIYHRQIDSTVSNLPGNSLGFIGGGASALQAYISFADGNGYFAGNLGIGYVSPSYKLDVNGTARVSNAFYPSYGVNLMRANGARTGISHYNDSYYNWQEYMSPAGTTSCGPNGNLTAPSGLSSVTSWAWRYRMESVSTYGFLWEKGGSGGGVATADPIMELNAISGTLSVAGNLVAYASDGRLKTNVKPIQNSLEKINSIRGVEYDWIDGIEEDYGFYPDSKHEVGVIAQEIEKVLPEAVITAPFNGAYKQRKGEDPNFLTVKYDRIVPLLIEAIKEQQQTISSLQERIDKLESK
jgi:hypothetical protein